MKGKRGRPKKDEELETYYWVKAEIAVNQQVITQEREKPERFILATNDLDLKADEILSYYKSQGKIERGFRFLKDKSLYFLVLLILHVIDIHSHFCKKLVFYILNIALFSIKTTPTTYKPHQLDLHKKISETY